MRISSLLFALFFLTACTTAPAPEEPSPSEPETQTGAVIENGQTDPEEDPEVGLNVVDITPISHATMVLEWDGAIFYTDPVGGAEAFAGQPEPDLILVTDIHGDHLSVETLEAVIAEDTAIIAPQAVYDEFSESLQAQTTILANGETTEALGFSIEGTPMYNLPESEDSRHVKGRGNGYLIEHNDIRLYIAGDTADIPEMRNLENIDIAFIPMNLPYTMDAATAADAVLDFAPRQVIPYHFREPEGFGDVEEFERIVTEANADIDVVQLEWYPES